MKSLSFKELDGIVEKILESVGAVLEDVVFNNDVLLLLFKHHQKKINIVVDARSRPFLLVTEGRVPSLKKQMKPLSLFLKARFLGAQLESVKIHKDYGRLVILKFSSGKELELHLFPQARNIIARDQGAQISLHKVSELQLLGLVRDDENPRTPEQIYQDWFQESPPGKLKPPKPGDSLVGEIEKMIKKKQQGLEDLRQKKNQYVTSPWAPVAQWMSEHCDLEVPEPWKECVDPEQSLAWNIERAFQKAKQLKEKIKAIDERLLILQKEIEHLKTNPPPTSAKVYADKTAIDGAKGRTKVLNDHVRAFIGKSAEDNLKILRKSKAWHLWLHVKDLPGSHGIIAFDKSVTIPLEMLREVATWVVEQSLSVKQREAWKGVKCDVIYCECRFVTPIRGDHLGRVTYKNEKTLTVVV